MYEDNATPELPKVESKLSVFGRVKNFAKKYQTPIAATGTGTVVFMVTTAAFGAKIDRLKFRMACLDQELAENAEVALHYSMFVDHKNLQAQFAKFVGELNA